jgi:hypothetical protein
MQDMLTLTTRMNALARITLGNVNIAATTALQVCKRKLHSPACSVDCLKTVLGLTGSLAISAEPCQAIK